MKASVEHTRAVWEFVSTYADRPMNLTPFWAFDLNRLERLGYIKQYGPRVVVKVPLMALPATAEQRTAFWRPCKEE